MKWGAQNTQHMIWPRFLKIAALKFLKKQCGEIYVPRAVYSMSCTPQSRSKVRLGSIMAGTRLGDTLGSTMVTTYDIEARRTLFLKSWHPDHEAVLCRDAARATSAAPTYFEPALISVQGQARALVDGGVFVNSPVVSAYAEALKLYPGEPLLVMSLGTGELVRPIPYESAKDWGQAGWVMPLLDCMFDGATKAANHQMRMFLGDMYFRLQVSLDEANDDMDDASSTNIENLKRIADRLISENQKTLDRLLLLLA
jgi:predicted acylesterase/phospholipase RssA